MSDAAAAGKLVLQICAVDFTAYHLLGGLIRGCRDAGYRVEFACGNGPFAARLRAEGFMQRALPISRSVAPVRNLWSVVSLAWSLRRDPPDLIHTHTPIGGIVGRLAALVRPEIPVVHTFHGLPLLGDRPTRVEGAFLDLERFLARRTTAFFSQAHGDAERAVALGIARGEDMTVIGNGIDLTRFRPDDAVRSAVRSELGIGASEVVIITVARLVREKGLLDLAEAMFRWRFDRPTHVLLVGTALPSDRQPIVAELDRHPVTRGEAVRWTRLGHRDDTDRLLKAADIFVLPSYREGLPRSVIEALATGLPVVATDIPGCRELVDASVGTLVPVRDAPALGAAIAALAADAERRSALGGEARRRALRRHDERVVVRTQLDRFARLVR